ncbi:MAG: sigma-70 family RNA polymerase sigma factor [Alphaproteobacteria bacterium]|nr:MAG: sigma-70 family RNA polymerase sigma factor [Alphaproteobacteria bacterium]
MSDPSLEDDVAFGRDLAAMTPHMRAFAISLCHSRAEADDIVQTALIKAWRGRSGFVRGTNLKAWLFTIVRHHFYSIARAARWRGEMSELQWERVEAPPSPIDGMFELDAVRRALGRLPLEQREAVVLIGAGGMTYDEVAAVTGSPIGTVKSRLSRGRAALLAALEELVLPQGASQPSAALDDILTEVRDRREQLGLGEDDALDHREAT